jgi:toxin ParE1/3/4
MPMLHWMQSSGRSEYVVWLRPAARDDLDAAARWYEAQERGLGRQFLAEVRLVFRRFPYGVIYWPVPSQGYIVVLAVLHCGRNPRLLRQRSRI